MSKIRPPGIQPDTSTNDLQWLVTEYVYNRGSSYRPTLEDMIRKVPVSTEDLFNIAPCYIYTATGGVLSDTYIPQYTNRLYSTYIHTKGKVSVPVTLGWEENITIWNTWNNNTYQIYQDDTSWNKTRTSSNFSISLGEGINRIDIIIYASSDTPPFSLGVDMSQIFFAGTPQIVPCIAEGNIDYTVTETQTEDTKGIGEGCNFFVRRATLAIWDISDNATPGYSADFDSLSMYVKNQDGLYPDAADSNGNGFLIVYSGPATKTLSVTGRWMAFGVRLG